MYRTVLIIVVSLLAGFAGARLLSTADEPAPAAPSAAPSFDPALPLEERIRELERVVSEERQARQLLQEEVLFLTESLDGLNARVPAGERPAETRLADVATSPEEARALRRARGEERRLERLVAAGLPEDRAQWILNRESQLRMRVLEARHEAERAGTYAEYEAQTSAARQAFRDELGEADYERYLAGTGRPTAVVVASVMDTSPAQRVGLLPGDRIVSYGGTRVYNMGDLNRATLEGTAGETVLVQIERDGVPMQVALPRGPVGVSSRGRGRR